MESNLKEDQTALKELSLGVEKLQQLQTQSKYQFVKEMESLNDEMGDALRRWEESGLEALLNVDTCQVLKHFLERKVHVTDVNCQPQGSNNDNERSQWVELLHDIASFAERLETLNGMCTEEKENITELFDNAMEFRNAVQLQNNEALGDEELDSLEKLWEASTEFDENLHGGPNDMLEAGIADCQPTHMQLIYDGQTHVESNAGDYDMHH